MKLRYIFVAILLLIQSSIFAESSQKSADIDAIVEQTGMKTWFHERSEARLNRAKKVVDRVKETFVSHVDSLSPEKRHSLVRSIDKYNNAIQSAYSLDEQLRVWVEAFGATVSDEDAHQIRVLYESPLGQTLLRSSTKASDAIADYNSNVADKVFDASYKELVSEVERLMTAGK